MKSPMTNNQSNPVAARRTPLRHGMRPFLAILTVTMLSGCEAIGTIFEAGVWVGVIIVIGIVAIVAVIAAMLRR